MKKENNDKSGLEITEHMNDTMKLCKHPICKCKEVRLCALCKHYNWNNKTLNENLYADLKCNLKGEMVKGFDCCDNFICFRFEEDE